MRPWEWVVGMMMVVLVLGVMGGCATTPTETDRQINSQNIQAGDQLSKHDDPVVAQTGTDVRENSRVLEKTVFGGPPKTIIPYTPELAAKLREQAMKEFEANQPWYKKFGGWILGVGLPALLMIGGIAGRFFPATAPVMAIATPVLGALTQIKQAADAQADDKLSIDQITPIISSLTKIPRIGPLIAAKLKDLHLDQIIHAPEAPDPTPPPVAAPAA